MVEKYPTQYVQCILLVSMAYILMKKVLQVIYKRYYYEAVCPFDTCREDINYWLEYQNYGLNFIDSLKLLLEYFLKRKNK